MTYAWSRQKTDNLLLTVIVDGIIACLSHSCDDRSRRATRILATLRNCQGCSHRWTEAWADPSTLEVETWVNVLRWEFVPLYSRLVFGLLMYMRWNTVGSASCHGERWAYVSWCRGSDWSGSGDCSRSGSRANRGSHYIENCVLYRP